MCGSSRRRPITSPPGGGTLARPSRASSGPASRNDARIRSASTASTSCDESPRDGRAPRSPVHSALAPVPQTSSSIVSTSRMRGTFESVTGSSVSRQAARIGSAPFLFPEARMRPLSGFPPSMTKACGAVVTDIGASIAGPFRWLRGAAPGAGGYRRQLAERDEGEPQTGVSRLCRGAGDHQQRGAVDLNPATVATHFDVAMRLRVGHEQTRPDPEADVPTPDLHRVVDVVARAFCEDLPRLPAR